LISTAFFGDLDLLFICHYGFSSFIYLSSNTFFGAFFDKSLVVLPPSLTINLGDLLLDLGDYPPLLNTFMPEVDFISLSINVSEKKIPIFCVALDEVCCVGDESI
jgi:hypothetical protein